MLVPVRHAFPATPAEEVDLFIHLVECRPIKCISDSQEESFEEQCSALVDNSFFWYFCYNAPLLSAVFELWGGDLGHLVPLCMFLFLLFAFQPLSLWIGNSQRYPSEIADGYI